MKTHEQFSDDLARYALDELTGGERKELEQHVENCAACRRELQTLRGDLGLLGLTSSGPQPPSRSKERLMRAIAAEPRGAAESPVRARGLWAALIPALAALVLLLVALGLLQVNSRLKNQMAELSSRDQQQTAELERANEELRLLSSGEAIHVSLKPQNMPMQPSGTAIFSPSQKRMMFMASNLAPAPAGKAYELWIIPAAGAPIPAGVFKPDNHGNAMMVDHTMPEGVEAKAFAITIENERGSDRPTSAILLTGAVS